MAAADTIDRLPQWAAALLEAAPAAHLGLLDESGHPRVQPITFAVLRGRLVTAVDHKPKRVPAARLARVRRLRADPRATITVDRYDADWSRLAWVQALGRITICAAADAPEEIGALVAKYPGYRETAPGGPILSLAPDRVLYWRAGSSAGETGADAST